MRLWLTVPDTVRRKLKHKNAHFEGGGKKFAEKTAAAAASGANAGNLASLMEAVPFYGEVAQAQAEPNLKALGYIP